MMTTDRGEKIVNLARELLRTEAPIEPEASLSKISLSFKALCFATILTAFGSNYITQWVNDARRPLNHYERVELDALLYYAAHTKGLDQKNLRHEIEQKLSIADFDDMTEAEYITARRYLQNTAL